MTNRTLRISRLLVREAVHYDTETRERLRFNERVKSILKYQGRSDIFGSFTKILKLGINPDPVDELTPVGVYCYQIDYLIDKYNSRTEKFDVPFANWEPYLHIFQVNNLERVLVFKPSLNKLTWRSLQLGHIRFKREIQQFPQARIMSDRGYLELEASVLSEGLCCADAYAYKITQRLAGYNNKIWTGLLRKLGLIGVIDYGTNTISSEAYQAVFFDPGSIKVLEVVDNDKSAIVGGQGSVWSQDLVKGVGDALKYFNYCVSMIYSSYKSEVQDTGIFKKTLRTIAWLNDNAKDDPSWVSERKIWVEKLELLRTFEPNWGSRIQGIVGQIIRHLQG